MHHCLSLNMLRLVTVIPSASSVRMSNTYQVLCRLYDIDGFFSSGEKSLPKSQGVEQKPNGCKLKINTDESY